MDLGSPITAALDYTPIGILVVRRDYNVRFWNACLEDWTGIPRADMIGHDLTQRYPQLGEPLYRSRLEGVFAGGPPVVFSAQLHRCIIPARLRDGTLRVQQTTVTAIPSSDGQDTYAMFAIQDLTDLTRQVQDYRRMRDQALAEARERRRAEEEVRQHAVELEARNADLDAFSHTVAHDLKAPLNLIQGYSDLILDYGIDTGTGEGKQYLKEIGRAVHRMNRIIREILLLSQVRKAEVTREPLIMSDIIDEACARLTDVIAAKQATLDRPDQWPVATGYGPWIEEVWANYLSNALKYGGHPPHMTLGADAPMNGQVRFWIKDNGQGLTAADCDRLFTQFTRLDQVDAQGHGLGLSIVRRIIEKLGGEVGVTSELNQGSTFSFTLPVSG